MVLNLGGEIILNTVSDLCGLAMVQIAQTELSSRLQVIY